MDEVTEADVPGASLSGREPSNLKIPELKRWLQCRGASTRGKKADLVSRVKAYISNGWSNSVIDPDRCIAQGNSARMILPDTWQDIKTVYKSSSEIPPFSNAQIVSYFVTRTVSDGLASSDFKSLNQSALNLFRCGHVQSVEVSSDEMKLFIRAKCLPEMKRDRVYRLCMFLSKDSSIDILGAECGCPGGKGPAASCKHIAALCYAFLNFCEQGIIPDFLTCTEKLQEWNKPRKRNLDPIPVTAIRDHQQTVASPTKSPRCPRVPLKFDPRPLSLRQHDPKAVEKLRTTLINLNKRCAFLTILVPSVVSIEHDHSYSRKHSVEINSNSNNNNNDSNVQVENSSSRGSDVDVRDPCPIVSEDMLKEVEQLQVARSERERIELLTRKQRDNLLWYEVRFKRLTGSKSSQILAQKTWTPSLLQRILYPKPFISVPIPIQWGIDHEAIARRVYTKFMHTNNHLNLSVEDCGFLIHPQEGWIGASPDGAVVDPTYNYPKGILEIKCPYSMRDVPPDECCKDTTFYCFFDEDGKFRLRRDHTYYHQVQVQLFVCSDQYSWCDFCIYTTKGVLVERIFTDYDWIDKSIPILKQYFDTQILPELVYPMNKPPYFL